MDEEQGFASGALINVMRAVARRLAVAGTEGPGAVERLLRRDGGNGGGQGANSRASHEGDWRG